MNWSHIHFRQPTVTASTIAPFTSLPFDSNIYRTRLSASNCSRLAFVAGGKLTIVLANVFHSRRPARFAESPGEKKKGKRKKKGFVKRVCRYHESSSSSSLLQSVQPSCKNAPLRYKRSLGDSRIYFARFPARDRPCSIDPRGWKISRLVARVTIRVGPLCHEKRRRVVLRYFRLMPLFTLELFSNSCARVQNRVWLILVCKLHVYCVISHACPRHIHTCARMPWFGGIYINGFNYFVRLLRWISDEPHCESRRYCCWRAPSAC